MSLFERIKLIKKNVIKRGKHVRPFKSCVNRKLCTTQSEPDFLRYGATETERVPTCDATFVVERSIYNPSVIDRVVVIFDEGFHVLSRRGSVDAKYLSGVVIHKTYLYSQSAEEPISISDALHVEGTQKYQLFIVSQDGTVWYYST